MPRIGRRLTAKQMTAFTRVSTRAKRLFTRLMEGHFYPIEFGNESAAWIELVEAGLVARGGRIKIMVAAYVPAGTKPFVCETFPTWPPMVIGEPKAKRNKLKDAIFHPDDGRARVCK